jgi:glycerol uptake facilitator protein
VEARGSAAYVEPVPVPPVERGPAAYLAELIGTFGLVFFITAAVTLFAPPPSPDQPIQPFIDWSVIGLVHVLALFLLIQTLALVSGAHFNPAVTVAMTAIRQIKVSDAAVYIMAQLTGGVLGALLTKALLLDEGDAGNYGATAVSSRLDEAIFPGMIAEMTGAFFLVWAIVGVAVNPSALRDWAALVIGGTLGLAVMVIGPLTGGGFNPARSFGPALVDKAFDGADTFLLVYVAGPVIGALLAAIIYSYLFILPGAKGPRGMEPVG